MLKFVYMSMGCNPFNSELGINKYGGCPTSLALFGHMDFVHVKKRVEDMMSDAVQEVNAQCLSLP